MTQNISSKLQKAFFIISALIGVFVVKTNIGMVQGIHYMAMAIVVFVFVCIFCVLLNLKIEIKIVIVLSISLFFRLLFMIVADPVPQSDFEVMFEAAIKASEGDFSVFESRYFQTWDYQIPFTLYQALVYRITGSEAAIKFINVLFMVGTNWIIYEIARRVAGEKPAIAVALLYAVYPAPVWLASVLTNQHIATFFFWLAALLFVKKSMKGFVLAGISLAVSDIMRSEGIILVLSITTLSIFMILNKGDRSDREKILKGVGLFMVAFVLVTQCVSLALGAAGFRNREGGNLHWKLFIGLNRNTLGSYDTARQGILNIEDVEERKAEIERIIKEDFNNPGEVVEFLYKKVETMWSFHEGLEWSVGETDMKASVPFSEHNLGTWIYRVQKYDKAYYTMIWILFTLSYALKAWKSQSGEDFILLMSIIIMGSFAIYMLIEIQARYRYNIMPAVFISASPIIGKIIEKIKKEKGELL